jgi:hypothetical protein
MSVRLSERRKLRARHYACLRIEGLVAPFLGWDATRTNAGCGLLLVLSLA